METSQYLRRTREQILPGRASIIDNRTNITTIKLLKLNLFEIYCTFIFISFVLLLYVPSQQLWSFQNGQFT